MLDRLKSLLGGGSAPNQRGGAGSGRMNGVAAPPIHRPSNGLQQFFETLPEFPGLSILDFAGASQENISFITSMGHRLSSQDFQRALEATFGPDHTYEDQSDPRLMDEFIAENLSFEPGAFDGALVWDNLQLMSPHLLQLTVDRLYDCLRPGACLLAFFSANERLREVPLYTYRINDGKHLTLTLRGWRTPGQVFNNRSIEKLFHRFQSVKFFLSKETLREVIVKR